MEILTIKEKEEKGACMYNMDKYNTMYKRILEINCAFGCEPR